MMPPDLLAGLFPADAMKWLCCCAGCVALTTSAAWLGARESQSADADPALKKVEVTEYRLKQDVVQRIVRESASMGLINAMESYSEHKCTRWLATNHVTIVADPDRHFAFGGVAQLANGDLAVVYREGTKHGVEPIGKVCLSRSKDGGRTWLPRVTVFDRPNEDDRGGSISQMSDGTALLFTASGGMRTSADFGETWSEIRPTNIASPSGGVEDEEGHIVYGGQASVQKQFALIDGEPADLQACVIERSRDKGLSWERVGVATYTVYVKDKIEKTVLYQREPSLCVVPNKFYVMCTCCRMAGEGFIRVIRSADRGKTWGPVITTPVWGKPGHLLALKDGRVLLSYGYRRPPYGVRACLSYDYGQTWDMDNEIILRMDGGTPPGQARKVSDTDLGYPQSIQLKDGRIFTVYYFNQNGSNAYMAGTFWELPPRPAQTGKER